MHPKAHDARRAVFLDIDGTLRPHHGVVPDSARDAVTRARAAGHLVFISTGRSLVEIPDDVLSIGFDGTIAASGGHITLADGHLLLRRHISHAVAQEAVDLLEALDVHYFVEAEDGAYAGPGATAALAALWKREQRAAGFGQPEDAIITYVDRMARSSRPLHPVIDKITFFDAGRHLARIHGELTAKLTVAPPSMPWLGPAAGELTVLGISKGTAVDLVLETLQIPVEASVAFGDGPNDLEMLQVAGVSVAMADAPPEVRATATQITDRADEDGIAKAFVRLGLVA